jgi:hypothetical protein
VIDDPRRRRALLEAKLGALVRDQAGEAPCVFGPFGTGGAALLRDGEAWILADQRPARALGPAMAWARQQGARSVAVLAESDTGLLARRSAAFGAPPSIWRVDGRRLLPAEPQALPAPPPVDPRVLDLVALIEAAGADAVVEHGVLAGEVAGLEVCRAVVDADPGPARLEVGVGAHDREAFRLLHGDVPPEQALAEVVERVAVHRQPGAAPHPLNRLASERLLRHRLLAEPGLVDATALVAAPPPVPRTDLKEAVPCVAVGRDRDGRPLAVVCSVGIDLDLVPFATDVALGAGDDHQVVLAVPERDVHPVTVAMAGALRTPVDILGVPPPT